MKNLSKNSLLTGTLVAGALLATGNTQANSLTINFLGTGGELRMQLLTSSTNLLTSGLDVLKNIEGACGESKTKDAKCGESKTKDAKCGKSKAKDAKCGESKAKDAKCGESKAKEAKCGENTCGA